MTLVQQFLLARLEGAETIREEAEADMSSASRLTFWHFTAKCEAYRMALETYVTRPDAFGVWTWQQMSHTNNSLNLGLVSGQGFSGGQQAFQSLIGYLEVYGEIYFLLQQQLKEASSERDDT